MLADVDRRSGLRVTCVLLLTVVSALGSACSADVPSSDPSVGGTRTNDATAASSDASETAECAPPQVCGGPMPPGSYVSTSIGPTVEFEVGEDWSGGGDLAGEGFFLLDRSQRAPAAMTVTVFPGEVFSDPCSVGPTEPVGAGAADAAEWVTSLDFLDADASASVMVGGREAVQVDVTVTIGDACADPVVYLWPLPVSQEFHLNEGEQARFIFVDAGTRTLAYIIEAFPDADWSGFLNRATAVLETMTVAD